MRTCLLLCYLHMILQLPGFQTVRESEKKERCAQLDWTYSGLCTSCEEWVCPGTQRTGKGAGRRGQERRDERMGNDSCSTASHSALWLDPACWILHSGFVEYIFGTLAELPKFRCPYRSLQAGSLCPGDFSKGRTDFFAYILKYLWECWRYSL